VNFKGHIFKVNFIYLQNEEELELFEIACNSLNSQRGNLVLLERKCEPRIIPLRNHTSIQIGIHRVVQPVVMHLQPLKIAVRWVEFPLEEWQCSLGDVLLNRKSSL
jgi:hypothetical protein